MPQDKIGESLARAERLTVLTDFAGVAEMERQRRVTHLLARRAPGYLIRYMVLNDVGKEEPHLLGLWEVIKSVLLLCAIWAIHARLGLGPACLFILGWALSIFVACLIVATVMRVSRKGPTHDWVGYVIVLPLIIFLPGFFMGAINLRQMLESQLANLGLGKVLEKKEYSAELAKLQALDAPTLVREYAVREIETIKDEILGPQSELKAAETALQARFDQAEAQRLRAEHHLARADQERKPALEKGVELAQARVSKLRKTLDRHHDVMARALAILEECKASADKLNEVVADAQLLHDIEEQALQDEQHIALSDLAMEQAVGRLRSRVMELEGTLAQLETHRLALSGKDTGHLEYLERVEYVAERLATI